MPSEVEVATNFNSRINARDLDGLVRLMTDDHTFVDTEGATVIGRAACREAWQGFFEAYPDYRNLVATIGANGNLVTMVGRSECSQAELDGPALWSAHIRGDQVAEWRVHHDTAENRAALDIPRDE